MRSMESLRPGQTITDSMFDELRYGNSDRAIFVDTFESASAANAACQAFEANNGRHEVKHALHRMYNTWYTRRRVESQRLAKGQKKEKEEIEYARYIARQERMQDKNRKWANSRIRRNKEGRGKYL
jgi:hypothetical protein